MKNPLVATAVVIVNLILLILIFVERGSAGGGGSAPVLRGSALELVDSKGKIRAQINMESSGEVVLRLRDETGTIRVKFGASKNGSRLVLPNDSTEVGVHLLAKDTGSSLRLVDKKGKERLIVP
jgi:hypothetical protein